MDQILSIATEIILIIFNYCILLVHVWIASWHNYKIASFTVDHLVSEATSYKNWFTAKPKQINLQGNSCRDRKKTIPHKKDMWVIQLINTVINKGASINTSTPRKIPIMAQKLNHNGFWKVYKNAQYSLDFCTCINYVYSSFIQAFSKMGTFSINNLEIPLYWFAHFLFLNHNFLTEKIVM